MKVSIFKRFGWSTDPYNVYPWVGVSIWDYKKMTFTKVQECKLTCYVTVMLIEKVEI